MRIYTDITYTDRTKYERKTLFRSMEVVLFYFNTSAWFDK